MSRDGYTNMMKHLDNMPGDTYLKIVQDYLEDNPPEIKRMISPASILSKQIMRYPFMAGWLEWVVMEDLPFNIVEKVNTIERALNMQGEGRGGVTRPTLMTLSFVHNNILDRLGM
jgi:hypothetical protein